MEFTENGNTFDHLMKQLNLCSVVLGSNGNGPNSVTNWNYPLVWDTGALFEFTPYRGHFIDYIECCIPVNVIKENTMVIRMGTILHTLEIGG